MNRKPKCSDIDNLDFLRVVAYIQHIHLRWADRWTVEEVLYTDPTYSWINWKLVVAKARKLIKQGYLDGCACGCRGDFELTPKGKVFLWSRV